MMRIIFKSLTKTLLLWLDQAVCLIVGRGNTPSGIALIRLDGIGDFILWLDTAKEYRRIYPDEKITLIANVAWTELAKRLPFWDEVWSVEPHTFCSNPFYRWKVLHRVRRGRFKTVIQPTFSRILMQGDSLIRASGAKQRIGSVGDLTNSSAQDKVLSDRWYTRLLFASTLPMMELERNAEFISQLAEGAYSPSLPRLPVLQFLPEKMLPAGEYFILFPGSSWSGRQWPVAHFATMLSKLQRLHGWQPVLCGAPNEVALCQAIAKLASVSCLNLAGQTNLCELAELIRGARLLIGNETSAVHLAAAVFTPTVCILGGGHYGRFMPYSASISGPKPMVAVANHSMDCYHCNWHCNQTYEESGPVPCISNISVTTVLSAVQEALNMVNLCPERSL